jgi:hypothetical protein
VDSPVVVGHPYPIVEVCDQLPERLRCARHDALSKAVARAQIHKVRALAVAVDEFAAAEERPTVVIDHVLHFTPYHCSQLHRYRYHARRSACFRSLVASIVRSLLADNSLRRVACLNQVDRETFFRDDEKMANWGLVDALKWTGGPGPA